MKTKEKIAVTAGLASLLVLSEVFGNAAVTFAQKATDSGLTTEIEAGVLAAGVLLGLGMTAYQIYKDERGNNGPKAP